MENTTRKYLDKKYENVIGYIDELEDQFELGRTEVGEEFEKQKRRLSSYLDEMEKGMNKSWDMGKEKTMRVKSLLDELKIQVALGKAESKDKMAEQRDRIYQSLHNLRLQLNSGYEETSEMANEALSMTKERIGQFMTQFDLFKIQFHLGKREMDDTWTGKKQELTKQLHAIKVKANSYKDKGMDQWSELTSEISDSWNQFKQTFSDN